MKNYELIIKAIDGLSDNGFSGSLRVYDENGKLIRRKGISGATRSMVERLAKEFLEENNL